MNLKNAELYINFASSYNLITRNKPDSLTKVIANIFSSLKLNIVCNR